MRGRENYVADPFAQGSRKERGLEIDSAFSASPRWAWGRSLAYRWKIDPKFGCALGVLLKCF